MAAFKACMSASLCGMKPNSNGAAIAVPNAARNSRLTIQSMARRAMRPDVAMSLAWLIPTISRETTRGTIDICRAFSQSLPTGCATAETDATESGMSLPSMRPLRMPSTRPANTRVAGEMVMGFAQVIARIFAVAHIRMRVAE